MSLSVEAQFRRFLLATAAVTYLAAAVELLLVGHYEEPLQVAPFAMIGIGLAAIVWAWVAPRSASLRILRWVGLAVIVGSLVGVGLHVKGNVEFALETLPDASFGALAWKGMSGRNPLLAPGMIALAGILAAAATYRHPLLTSRGIPAA